MFDELRDEQAGVVTRQQAREHCGLTAAAIRARLESGRWQRLHRGVYWTFSGPPNRAAVLWAALLAVGDEAVLSHETAAELHGLLDAPAATIHVSMPDHRRGGRPVGVRVHRRGPPFAAMPARRPARTGIEDTVVDLTQSAKTLDQAIAWIAQACARRLTTPARLAKAISGRPWLRRREALLAAVADVGAGCHSVLEVRYLRDVERGHGLPKGNRQHRRRAQRATTYSDVEYPAFRLVVEVDGQVDHQGAGVLRDRRRDNRATADGRATLRFGWADVNERACATAAIVATALRSGGWTGEPRRCGAGCEAKV